MMATEIEHEKFIADLDANLATHGVRFAACRPDGKHSGVWLVWANNCDYYLGARNALGSLKVSLHRDRISRVAFNKEYVIERIQRGLPVPTNRAFVEWQRAPTPESGAVLAASVKFPINYLQSEKPVGKPKKPIFTFESNEPNKAIEFGFFFSREPATTLEQKLIQIGKPLFRTTLDNGDTVSMVARVTSFDPSVIPAAERIAASITFFEENGFPTPGVERKNLNAILWNDPKESEALQVIEIGGVSVKRNK